MDYNESFKEIEKTLSEIREENKRIPIVVEGEKDKEALHKLDINGTIITVNSGVSLTDFCDKLAQNYKEILILTDWDRRGGYLCHTIKKNLEGRVNCNTYYREILAKNTVIKTIEGLPSWLKTMQEKFRII